MRLLHSSQWIWWICFIVLLLRLETQASSLDSTIEVDIAAGSAEDVDVSSESSTTNKTTDRPKTTTEEPKTAVDLGVPRCDSNYDCVHDGVCRKDSDGEGRCLCRRTCAPQVPLTCRRPIYGRGKVDNPCLVMNPEYTKKYDVIGPACHQGKCVCPPLFDDVAPPAGHPLKRFLPTKCDKRDLKALGVAYPSDSVFRGTDIKLFCCLNMDPEGFVDAAGVKFVQNLTVIREPTKHPFDSDYQRLSDYERINSVSCWELEVKNVQLSDSGSYMCIVTSSTPRLKNVAINSTIILQVKEHEKRHHHWYKRSQKVDRKQVVARPPRMIQHLKVSANDTAANVTWEAPDELNIDLRLLRRTDRNGAEVFALKNASSPLTIGGLRAATPYTLFVLVRDGSTEPQEQSEHFQTAEIKPHPPKFENVTTGIKGTNLMTCDVEWRKPSVTNGRISKYYVRVSGKVRTHRPGAAIVANDYPAAMEEEKCANYDEKELPINSINPIEFTNDFFNCKYGPLKPNRNYTVTVWAENTAGKSVPIIFPKQCITPYAQPDLVEKPVTSKVVNYTAFTLDFPSSVDDTNGPISCYYIAVVPLHMNVSIDSLPKPQEIVMDTAATAFENNLHYLAAEKKRYFGYIAESYYSFPTSTVLGDGGPPDHLKCNVLYLSRYRAEDTPLQRGLKYTGFLVARVDKEEANAKSGRSKRQSQHGPAYGYSSFFKPVALPSENEESIIGTVVKIVIPIIAFLAMATIVGLIFLHHRGGGAMRDWCPLLKSKDRTERSPLRAAVTYQPTVIDDLPSEYMLKHRDTDFEFVREFESLPTYKLDASASRSKDNASKNRYNDIHAFDSTRVRLKKIPGVDHSDYINANTIMGYADQKTFIAAQAPLENTINDFWRMIWEQESYVIVMVANLTEKNRQQCSKYWPDDAATKYGDITVVPTEAVYYADYAIRSFDVTNSNSTVRQSPTVNLAASLESNVDSEYANVPSTKPTNGHVVETSFGGTPSNVRRIVQYHFTNWNDYKAPECSTGLLRFIHRLRQLPTYNNFPVTIHCSAGVGRTGTFIAIDSMLDELEVERKADIFGFVSGLRKQRFAMVQSIEQYVFIYKALSEWYLFGHTDMDIPQLVEHYKTLCETPMRDRSSSISNLAKVTPRSDSAPISGMEVEFKKLEHKLETPPNSTFAKQDDNLMKNRFCAAVPYDRNRVVLSPTLGYANTTYINASKITGYFYPYVLAQDPISECTVFDFWRMISELNVRTVVMLSNEEDWSISEKYWPDELNTPTNYDKHPHRFTVSLTAEERHSTYIMRTMDYDFQTNGHCQTIVQYVFTAWPSGEIVPSSCDPLLLLMGRVLERHSGQQDSGPIVLHCRDGSSETGVYCCVSLLLERLKAEQKIDVFQTVRGLQTQRPMMFTHLDQYSFCYRAVLDYLRSTNRIYS